MRTHRRRCARRDPSTLGEFIVGTYLPFKRRRWKLSTAVTTEDRVKRHIIEEIGDRTIDSLDRDALQELLDRKAESARCERRRSSPLRPASHLRDGRRRRTHQPQPGAVALHRPAGHAKSGTDHDPGGGARGLSKLELRERLIWKLAVFGGLRPGEIFALQRKHVQSNAVKIEQRVYAGNLDTPKSRASSRLAAIPATLVSELQAWLTMLPEVPDFWVFPSETGLTPVRPENVWRRWIGPRLERDRPRLGQLPGASPHPRQLGARGGHRPEDPSRPDGQRDRREPGRIHGDRAGPANGRRRVARSVSPSLMECWSVSPIGE